MESSSFVWDQYSWILWIHPYQSINVPEFNEVMNHHTLEGNKPDTNEITVNDLHLATYPF